MEIFKTRKNRSFLSTKKKNFSRLICYQKNQNDYLIHWKFICDTRTLTKLS